MSSMSSENNGNTVRNSENLMIFGECPRKYSGMSSEIQRMSSKIQRDVLGNTGNVLDVLGNTGNRNVLDILGNTAGSVPGLSGSETHLLDSEISWGCPRNSVMSSKIQKCLVFFRMSSKIQNPICPRKYKLSMLIVMSFFIERKHLS